MIIWKLRKVMDEKGIKGKDLAIQVGKHPNTISNLRNSKDMPSIDGNLLNKLCNALDCTLSDLIEFIPDTARVSREDKSSPNPSSTLPPKAAVVAAAAIGAAQAMGSTDPSLVAEIAASLMKVLLKTESDGSS